MSATAHIGDIGTRFELIVTDEDDAIVDISSATTKEMIFKPPCGVPKTQTAAFVTDGTDGKIEYVTTAASDLDEAGTWYRSAHVVLTSGTWSSDWVAFEVRRNLA